MINIPEGIIELSQKPVKIANATNVLIISDLHFPFHDKRAIETALNYRDKIDTIVLLGDLMDIYQGSRFSKDPSIAKLKDELNITKEFLKHIREKFKTAQIYYYEGNHEMRMDRYVMDHAPILFGMESIRLHNLLELKKQGIVWVENGVGMKISSLHLLHGNEAGSRGGINIARTMILKTNDNCLFGNFHKTQESSGRNLDGKEFANWSIGCLCNLKPRYMPINAWNLGFALLHIDGKEFEVSNKRILENYNVR
jgi:predicted phosphodiesterase